MIALRIGSLVASIAGFVGCTLTADKTTDCCANYERPGFVISFFPESLQDKEPIVDISEDSNGAAIRVNWPQEQYRISDTSGYPHADDPEPRLKTLPGVSGSRITGWEAQKFVTLELPEWDLGSLAEWIDAYFVAVLACEAGDYHINITCETLK